MDALEQLMQAFGNAGGDRAVLADSATAHLVADGHTILSSRAIEGVEVEAHETASGISATVRVRQGVRLTNPVHLCFGVLHKKGTQNISMDVRLEKNASASFIAHCIFPDAEQVIHTMERWLPSGKGRKCAIPRPTSMAGMGASRPYPRPLSASAKTADISARSISLPAGSAGWP